MQTWLVVVAWVLLAASAGWARTGVAPDPAGPDAVQHGAQPNPGEVRPGSPDGDSPSASAGAVLRARERRILGLPVSAALVIGGVLVALLVLAGLVIPAARRRERARGGGTYGP
jgi:hypothetical protein